MKLVKKRINRKGLWNRSELAQKYHCGQEYDVGDPAEGIEQHCPGGCHLGDSFEDRQYRIRVNKSFTIVAR